ncbi:hypothetical protein QR680_004926 [Steinernema hermaphroditum]|uniref:C2H2-type domain-containing protein n=1 Tax=Steinernema hermaphroditum TaxID=289476 RepID=A0AA39LTZ9_9BILA|nr:hypothetical protein QR680_004926 [Steinernema hermaphroditum]
MSLGDFLVHRLLSVQRDAAVASPVPSCSSSDDGAPPPTSTASLFGPQQALALQLAQFQMLYQAAFLAQIQQQQQQQIKSVDDVLPSAALSPSASSSASSSDSSESRKRPAKPDPESTVAKKAKAPKRTHLEDAETNSPVSGMFIKDAAEIPSTEELQKEADLDETASYVHVSVESKRLISLIPNVIGDSVCALCKVRYEDVFKLAQHKCPRIAYEAYKCPECDKVFSCPANLASHRRWHKPRSETQQACSSCDQKFDSKKQLKAHHCLLSSSPAIASLLFS